MSAVLSSSDSVRRCLSALVMVLLISGCAPTLVAPVSPVADAGSARLEDQRFVTADGEALGLSVWPVAQPKAIVIALHGFNDYRKFFATPAEFLQQQGIASYAYDQRGFGESRTPGLWAGDATYADDLGQFTRLVQARHPGVPVYLLGESMGGAVVINAMTRPGKPAVAGVILAAPAVWGRDTMPWYQTSLLWTLYHTVPWMTLTGKGLKIMPSDNIEMLRALGRDPLVIKETRVDAIYGLANLMDNALGAAEKLDDETLLLYGQKDQIVPAEPTNLFVEALLSGRPDNKTVAYYQNGYHMLLRDLQAPVIWRDINAWIDRNLQRAELQAAANRL
ncbi:alpha/beta hydrolase [Methylomonas sp. DH-1]|nr:alpha/beta hydrolase [Methylomonas sp. DH-1]